MNRPLETLPSQPEYSKAAGPGRRLLIVTHGIPHPTEGGSTVVFYEYIKAAKAAGFTILNLLLLQPDNASEARLAEYRRGLEEAGPFEVVTCSSERFITLHRLRITFDKAAMTPLRDRILAFDPDAVLALDIMAAWAIAEFPLKGKVVWLGDLNFETLWYGAIYGRREGNRGLKDLVGNTLYALIWALIYRKVLRRFDSIIVCAKSSEAGDRPAWRESALSALSVAAAFQSTARRQPALAGAVASVFWRPEWPRIAVRIPPPFG